ncbi:MAG: InlB B-repeat-containing protein [Firmicutes bacterium]|nr:InlB B-repeat-containing protein [Bacillota bacterium]
MIRNILKRTVIFLLTAALVITAVPQMAYAADVSGLTVSGLTASYSNGEWSGSGSTLNGSATGTAESSCSSATSVTSTLTLKNSSGAAAMLSFSYSKPVLGSGGSVTVDGTAVTAAGEFSKELANGASVNVVIVSGSAGAYTSSVELSNLKVTVKKTVTTTFIPAGEGGSFKAGGAAVSEQYSNTQDSTVPYSLVATPSAGYSFMGWYSPSHDRWLAPNATYTHYSDDNMSVTAVFVKEGTAIFNVDGKYYSDLNEAAGYASAHGSSKITLMKSGMLAAGSYTIPSGKTLLIPYEGSGKISTTKPEIFKSVGPSAPSAYSSLTLSPGAELIINGALNVNGKVNSTNVSYTGVTSGAYGRLHLYDGSSVILNNGANLYCWGYITGAGSVTAKPGSSVYEPFQIHDLRGGTATTGMNGNSSKVMPFSQYYIQNIEARLIMEYGATEKVVGSATVQNSTETPLVTFVGSSGAMFTMTSGGRFEKTYDPSTDRVCYDIYGSSSLNSISISAGISIDTAKYVLPIMQSTSIRMHSGTITVNQDLCMIPGSEMSADSGATVNIPAGKNIYVYDRDEWAGKGYIYPNTDMRACYYSPTRKTTFSASMMKDTVVDVNGTVSVSGKLYTTSGGADIISSEKTGQVVFAAAPAASANTYQATQSGTDISYSAIAVNAPWLHNVDGSYTQTAGASAGAVYFFCADHGKWETGRRYTISFSANGGQGDGYTQTVCSGECTLIPNAFTATGEVEFIGWNTEADGSGTAYEDGGKITATADITLYAQWKMPEHVHELVKTEAADPTCEEPGRHEYWTCSICGLFFADADGETEIEENSWIIEALGHDWGEPTYIWSKSYTNVVASRTCKRDVSHTETETVSASYAVVAPAGCEEDGLGRWTSEAFKNSAFKVQIHEEIIPATGHTKGEPVRENEVAPSCMEKGSYDEVVYCTACGKELSREHKETDALGHDWGEPTYIWAEDNSSVTASRTCSRDAGHKETETAQATYEVVKEPTVAAPGLGRYTAVFINSAFETQTKDVEIAQLTVPVATVTGISLDLQDKISVQFKIQPDEDLAYAELALQNPDGSFEEPVKVVLDKADTSVYRTGEDRFVLRFSEITTRMISQGVKLTVYNKDGEVLDIYRTSNEKTYTKDDPLIYSAADWCRAAIDRYGTDKTQKAAWLAMAVLNLGGESQKYFEDYNSGNPANPNGYLADDMAAFSKNALFDQYISDANAKKKGYSGMTLDLAADTRLRVKFTANVAVSVDGEPATLVKEGDKYVLDITGLRCIDLDQFFEIKFKATDGSEITMNMCALSWSNAAYDALGSNPNHQTLKLAKAVCLYSQAAENYFK